MARLPMTLAEGKLSAHPSGGPGKYVAYLTPSEADLRLADRKHPRSSRLRTNGLGCGPLGDLKGSTAVIDSPC